MAPRNTPIRRTLSLVLVILFLWWISPSIIKSFTKTSFYEFQAPAWLATSYLSDLQDFWGHKFHSKNELIEAGRDLARSNAAYQLEAQINQFRETERKRLESFFKLPEYQRFDYVVARVIQRDLNNWWQQIIIRKGKHQGITEGAAVVYAGGIVGRVREVRQYTSVIDLITSANFRVAAHIEGDLRPITYQGSNSIALSDPQGNASNIPSDITATEESPRRVVSSRLGGNFPDGLTIGWLKELENSHDGLFKQGTVHIEPTLTGIREVAVLVPSNPQPAQIDE